MSLTDEAVQVISSYRQNVLREPMRFKIENQELRKKLSEIASRDSNIFYTVNEQSFLTFPENEKFDRDEYLTFRYLFESSYAVRRMLTKQKVVQLTELAERLLNQETDLNGEYDTTYNRFSFESAAKRASLKAQAQLNGISSSKTFFVIQKVVKSPSDFNLENKIDWILPRVYKSDLHSQFRASARQIGLDWGIAPTLVEYYINHIEMKKAAEKAAIISAVAGGAVVAAWGISAAVQNHKTIAQAGGLLTATAVSSAIPVGPALMQKDLIQPLYGLENLAQFMAPQATPLIANQAAFLNHFANYGKANTNDVTIASINAVSNALTNTPTYGADCFIPTVVGTNSNSPGSILGANTNLTVREMSPGFATITGTINGQSVMTNIRQVGDAFNITSF